jgi:hypothetical protein
MNNKGLLINEIGLGYAPMSAYDFRKLIMDKGFRENVFDSHLYVIAQRKALTFNNFNFREPLKLSFEIKQDENPLIIKCTLPLVQENIKTDLSKQINLRLHDRKNTIEKKNGFPFDGTQGFSIQEMDITGKEIKTLGWFSPDKLFQNYWKGHIQADFSVDFREMCEFKVHYVGKSTEQNICQRLSNHSTFQEILTNEVPISYGNIPSNEIMILLLKIIDNNTIVSFGPESKAEDMTSYISDYILPSNKTLSLDAEKALIKHLQPEYNKILYNSFPKENDLIHSDYHSTIFYGFNDPITLVYKNGRIKGGEFLTDKDYISVER